MRGNVLMIGLGLIGGSVALSIKKAHPDAYIYGYDLNENNLCLAKSLKIIDESVVNYCEAAELADLIVIGVPVHSIGGIMGTLAGCNLKKNVLMTDVGSTKQTIMDLAERNFGDRHIFIGGHPMAGSHKSGVTAAKDHLFENAFYMLTPSRHAGMKEIAELKMWLKGTCAHFIQVEAGEHDMMTGVISHLPHIMAASMVRQAETAGAEHGLITRLAAGGFRDITRIASSSPAMWKDIMLHNDKVLSSLMDKWIKEMETIKTWIQLRDEEQLYSFFQGAKEYRDGMSSHTKGAIPSFYDLYVDVPDYPGIVSEITRYLAEERINLTNIRILETREEIYGVLVISFQTDLDRQKAVECIKKNTNYDTYID